MSHAVLVGALFVTTLYACGEKPQPMVPDGPEMDPDAAIYQEPQDLNAESDAG